MFPWTVEASINLLLHLFHLFRRRVPNLLFDIAAAVKSSTDQSPDDERFVLGSGHAAGPEREAAGGPVSDMRRAEITDSRGCY